MEEVIDVKDLTTLNSDGHNVKFAAQTMDVYLVVPTFLYATCEEAFDSNPGSRRPVLVTQLQTTTSAARQSADSHVEATRSPSPRHDTDRFAHKTLTRPAASPRLASPSKPHRVALAYPDAIERHQIGRRPRRSRTPSNLTQQPIV
uniref:Uncharacterized protein n=1 Tax=Oryza sativa subsp. japonica TaxID=39947 RepID=Q69PT2_ORYSJ|nr:hypothetical protein [Oryza sativa Japonica Group]BAD33504.1 hypothetical protein [Oryza sativa Japonica Group]